MKTNHTFLKCSTALLMLLSLGGFSASAKSINNKPQQKANPNQSHTTSRIQSTNQNKNFNTVQFNNSVQSGIHLNQSKSQNNPYQIQRTENKSSNDNNVVSNARNTKTQSPIVLLTKQQYKQINHIGMTPSPSADSYKKDISNQNTKNIVNTLEAPKNSQSSNKFNAINKKQNTVKHNYVHYYHPHMYKHHHHIKYSQQNNLQPKASNVNKKQTNNINHIYKHHKHRYHKKHAYRLNKSIKTNKINSNTNNTAKEKKTQQPKVHKHIRRHRHYSYKQISTPQHSSKRTSIKAQTAHLVNHIVKQNTTPKPSASKPANNIPSSNVDAGLSQADLNARAWIVQHESGGRWDVLSYGGVCLGRYQLSPSLLKKNGKIDMNHEFQTQAANRYVTNRYGSWRAAQRFWAAHRWY